MKYDIEKIQQMRLDGLTLAQIATKLNTTPNALSLWLRRHGYKFSTFKKRCKYCNKEFQPSEYITGDYCSETCRYFNRLEQIAKAQVKYDNKFKIDGFGFIYQIKNVVNGKRYIGATKNFKTRFNEHKSDLNSDKHYNKSLQYDLDKYSLENFTFEVLVIVPEEDLGSVETGYIKHFDSTNPKNGYNKCVGGYCG